MSYLRKFPILSLLILSFCSRGKDTQIVYLYNDQGQVTGVSQNISNVSGGSLSLSKEASFSVTPGSLQVDSLTISLNRGEKLPAQGDIRPVGAAFRFGPENTEFLQGNQATFCYSAAELQSAGLEERTVQVYYLDPDTNQYESIGGSVDPVSHCVTAQIEHFSVYLPAAYNLSTVVGNNAPTITGTAIVPTQAIANLPLRIRVIVRDFDPNHTEGAIASAVLLYRMVGEATGSNFPHTIPLSMDTADVTGQRYYAVIPANHVTSAGIQYRIQVMDNLGALRQIPNATPTSYVSRTVPHTLNMALPLRFNNSALTIAAGFSSDFTLQAQDETNTWRNIEGDSFSSPLGQTSRVTPLRIRFTALSQGVGLLTGASGSYVATTAIDVRLGQLSRISILNSAGIPINSTLNRVVAAIEDFDVLGYDAYGNHILVMPTFSITGGIGTINNLGVFIATSTAPASGMIKADFAGFTSTVNININPNTIPVVIATSPSDGMVNLPINSDITVSFSEPVEQSTLVLNMNADCTGSAIQISMNNFNSCVPAAKAFADLSTDKLVAAVKTGLTLEYNTTYQIRISTSIKSLNGISLSSPYLTPGGFKTAAAPASSLAITGVNPLSNSIISNDQSIYVRYSGNLDGSTVTLSGDLANSYMFSVAANMLTLSPIAMVPAGSGQSLNISVKDLFGNSSPPLQLMYRVKSSLYVRPNGSDANSGTDPVNPKQTIQSAIDACVALGECDVRIGQGDYTGVTVTQKAGVALWGSYPADKWSGNDVALSPTSIQNLTVQDTVTNGTIVDNISIKFMANIYGSPTIQHSNICMAYVLGNSPILRSNSFTACSIPDFGGIVIETANQSSYPFTNCLIEGNKLVNGILVGPQPSGKLVSLTLRNNLISMNNPANIAFSSINGIIERLTMDNNTIVTSGVGIALGKVAKPLRIANNIIAASAGAIIQYDYLDSGSMINNNNFSTINGAGTISFQVNQSSVIQYPTPTDMEGYLSSISIISQNNTSQDPMFVSPLTGDYRLQANSGLKALGIDLSADFTTDNLNSIRSVPWSLGAFERN